MTAVAGGITQAADITGLAALTTGRPLVRLIQQATQNLTNAANTVITFGAGSEDIDTHGFHDTSTNPSRVTPTVAGYYRCFATLSMAASGAITLLSVVVAKNGTPQQPLVRTRPNTTVTAMSVQASAIIQLNGSGDYVEMIGNQTSGGTVATQASGGINSVLEVEFLRPF